MTIDLRPMTPWEYRHRRRLTRWLRASLVALVLVGLLRGTAWGEEQPRFTPSSRSARHLELASAYWPSDQLGAVADVIACESKNNPGAVGLIGEQGLMQIRPELWQPLADAMFGPGADLFDPEINVAVGAAIWRALGWSAWSCAR